MDKKGQTRPSAPPAARCAVGLNEQSRRRGMVGGWCVVMQDWAGPDVCGGQ